MRGQQIHPYDTANKPHDCLREERISEYQSHKPQDDSILMNACGSAVCHMEKNAHTYIIIFNSTIKRVLLMNNKRLFKGIFRVCLQLNIIYNLLSLYSFSHDIMFQFVKKRKCVYSNAVEAGKGLKASFFVQAFI